MKVRVFPYREKLGMGNIIWAARDRGSAYYRVSKFVMNHGRFPSNHPCAPFTQDPDIGGQIGRSASLDAFRARGYWASCFPEGDGITWKPDRGQSDDQCVTDIRDCFPGWELELCGPWNLTS